VSPSAPFGHVATAMITPFGGNGEVDHEKAWRLARYLADQGSDALVVTGTTGESPTLSSGEKLALYKTVLDAVAGKETKVIAGTGTYNTAESVDLTERAGEIGCHGVLAVTPYYNKPGQAGLVAHFEAIADVGIPVLLYNIPSRTGRLIEVETLARLSQHENIVGVKDAVMDIEFTSQTVNHVPSLPVYSGQDSHTWPMMAVGAIGVVSVISHLAGRRVSAMVTAALSGEMEKAREIHHELLPLCEACFLETNPTPVKGAMSRLWEPVGGVRLPLVDASEETLIAIEKAVGALQGL
jgi:4-hydroxy-tetrahydrodipicolinate synthase